MRRINFQTDNLSFQFAGLFILVVKSCNLESDEALPDVSAPLLYMLLQTVTKHCQDKLSPVTIRTTSCSITCCIISNMFTTKCSTRIIL
jgi:hypothetical protein